MNLYTRLTDLLVTGGSHVSHAILLDRSRPSKHFGARARIELWRGVRDRFSTVSTTVVGTSQPQSFNVSWRVGRVASCSSMAIGRNRYVIHLLWSRDGGTVYARVFAPICIGS